MNTIGNRIRSRRLELGLTQTELAKNVSPKTVSNTLLERIEKTMSEKHRFEV